MQRYKVQLKSRLQTSTVPSHKNTRFSYLRTCWNAAVKPFQCLIRAHRVPRSPQVSLTASHGNCFAAGSTRRRNLWTCCHRHRLYAVAAKRSTPRWSWNCARAGGRSACRCPRWRLVSWPSTASAAQHIDGGSEKPSEPHSYSELITVLHVKHKSEFQTSFENFFTPQIYSRAVMIPPVAISSFKGIKSKICHEFSNFPVPTARWRPTSHACQHFSIALTVSYKVKSTNYDLRHVIFSVLYLLSLRWSKHFTRHFNIKHLQFLFYPPLLLETST